MAAAVASGIEVIVLLAADRRPRADQRTRFWGQRAQRQAALAAVATATAMDAIVEAELGAQRAKSIGLNLAFARIS